ncbi:hypothetical protein OIU78_005344, partial [Salix suchowensis]
MDLVAKGDDLEKKAEKKLNGWGFFGSKHEDAADLFDKAANNFKLAKSSMSSPNFVSPFHIVSYFGTSPCAEAISCLVQAVDMFC